MKRRGIAVLLVALYVTAAAVFGFLPHEHGRLRIFQPGRTTNPNCATCIWQATAVADTPFVHTLIVPTATVVAVVLPYESVFVPHVVPLASASRAPPVPMA